MHDFGQVKNSIIFPGVTIEENAFIEDSIIMSKSTVKSGSRLNCTIVGEKPLSVAMSELIGDYAENI